MNQPAEKETLGSKALCYTVLSVIVTTCLLIILLPFNFWDGLNMLEWFLLGLSTITFVGLPLWLAVTGVSESRTQELEQNPNMDDVAPIGTTVPYDHYGALGQLQQFTKLQSDQQDWLAAVVGAVICFLLIVSGASLLAGDSNLWGLPVIMFGLMLGYGAVSTLVRWARFGKVVVKVSATTVAEGEDFIVAVFSSRQLSIEKLRVELVWKIFLPEDDEEPAEERRYPMAEQRNIKSVPGRPMAYLRVRAPEGGLPGEKVEDRMIVWDIRIRMDLADNARMVDNFGLCFVEGYKDRSGLLRVD